MKSFIGYFWAEYGETIIPIIVSLIFISCMFLSSLIIVRAKCFERTENMGFDSRWSLLGGCQIEVNAGQWIPLESYYFKQE